MLHTLSSWATHKWSCSLQTEGPSMHAFPLQVVLWACSCSPSLPLSPCVGSPSPPPSIEANHPLLCFFPTPPLSLLSHTTCCCCFLFDAHSTTCNNNGSWWLGAALVWHHTAGSTGAGSSTLRGLIATGGGIRFPTSVRAVCGNRARHQYRSDHCSCDGSHHVLARAVCSSILPRPVTG